jgi:hypothetical protein
MNSKHRSAKCLVPLALSWSHSGVSYRVTPWPEVRFERLYGEDWIAIDPSEDVLASAAQSCGPREWQPYLEFTPADVRAFIEQFTFARMQALLVAARCPTLLSELTGTPALLLFVADHVSLRGTANSRWSEISAVYEREGIFGVLQWLGLPSSRQTLTILRNVAAPDLPRKLLEPLRAALWEPEAIWALSHSPVLTDARLEATCHALAA